MSTIWGSNLSATILAIGISRTVCNPFEVLKVQRQLERSNTKNYTLPDLRSQHLLFAANAAHVLRGCIFFSKEGIFKSLMRLVPRWNSSYMYRLVVRCSSVIAVTLLSYPIERMKNIATAIPPEEGVSSGLITSLIRLVSRHGAGSLFVGFVPALVANLVHEASLRSLTDWIDEDADRSALQKLSVAGFVVFCSSLASYPFDTISKRMQFPIGGLTEPSSSAWDVANGMIREEGFFALWKGLGPMFIKIPLMIFTQQYCFALTASHSQHQHDLHQENEGEEDQEEEEQHQPHQIAPPAAPAANNAAPAPPRSDGTLRRLLVSVAAVCVGAMVLTAL